MQSPPLSLHPNDFPKGSLYFSLAAQNHPPRSRADDLQVKEVNPVFSTSLRIQEVRKAMEPFITFMNKSAWAVNRDPQDPEICDFTFGNPQEMPLPGYVQTLHKWLEPQDKNWFAYHLNEEEPRKAVSTSLQKRLGVKFSPEDIYLTPGAWGGLAVSLDALVEQGDEVIFISPPWFFYESLIVNAGGTPVRVRINPYTLDLDMEAIRKAITPRTRAIIINSPNNPTGRIYPPRTLERLSNLLTRESQRYRRTIFLISDESYSRIVFDDAECPSPAQYYPNTILVYTYGKTTLAPGQRLGYAALPQTMQDREPLGEAIFSAQLMNAYAFPNALLQHAIADLDTLSIDIHHLQEKRDRMVSGLRAIGYRVHIPEGTFYLMPVSPLDDDTAFVSELARHKVYCLPGTIVEMPGYFRISLTGSMDMIEQALPRFADAYYTLKRPRRVITPASLPRVKQSEVQHQEQ